MAINIKVYFTFTVQALFTFFTSFTVQALFTFFVFIQ